MFALFFSKLILKYVRNISWQYSNILPFEGEKAKSLQRKAHMTSLEAQTTSNSTWFSPDMWESSEDSGNSQLLYPVIFVFYSSQLHHWEENKRKEIQKLYCSTMGFYGFFFFLCCNILAFAYLKKKDLLGLKWFFLFK